MMDDQERQKALLTALTTEHFVLQTALNGTMSESSARAPLYIVTLSSSLIAMGFVAESSAVFLPFVATVLPAVFVLGVLTVLRLVDSALEMSNFLAGIARIRAHYRTLTPEAEAYFAPQFGRWPEANVDSMPVFKLGLVAAFLTTNATMIAFVNSLVAGAGVALLTSSLLGDPHIAFALGLGGVAVVVVIALFYVYQRWRITDSSEQAHPSTEPTLSK